MVTYFYSGAIVGTMMKGGIRDVSHLDGSITAESSIAIDDIIKKIKSKHCPRDTRLVHLRQLNKI